MKSNSFLNDNKYINKETLPYYANTNEEHLVLPVKGIVLEFPGLGGGSSAGIWSVKVIPPLGQSASVKKG